MLVLPMTSMALEWLEILIERTCRSEPTRPPPAAQVEDAFGDDGLDAESHPSHPYHLKRNRLRWRNPLPVVRCIDCQHFQVNALSVAGIGTCITHRWQKSWSAVDARLIAPYPLAQRRCRGFAVKGAQ